MDGCVAEEYQIVQIKNFYYNRNHYYIECGRNAANAKKQGAVFQKKILQVSEKSPLRKKMSEIRGTVEHMLISDHPLT